MKLFTVLGKGLISGLLLCCTAIWIGVLPLSLDIKFYLQIATIAMSVPVIVSWMYDFR